MMGLIVSEVYDALIEAGASPDRAKAAAGAVPPAESMATKEDMAKLQANMATKEDVARLEGHIAKLDMATKEDFARLEGHIARVDMAHREDFARLEARIAKVETNMATKEDFSRLEKQIAVLRFAVFSFGPAILALLAKLTFFP